MNSRSKKPTLQDVADAAGVSTATISRCLNQPDKVKDNVREKIHQTIADLGYVPHGAARALASSKTQTVGIIVPTIDNVIFAKTIQHLQLGLTQHGYTLLVASSDYSLDEELREVQSLLARGVDGLVLVGEQHHPGVYNAIEQQAIPHVNLWTYRQDSPHPCIGFDHLAAGAMIAKHVISAGHRHIGIISGFLTDNDRAELRLAGMRQSFEANGVNLNEANIQQCRYTIEDGRAALISLKKNDPEITAVLCGNDILAIGAIMGARDLQLDIPTQLSITGFDNIEMAAALEKPLTTVSVPAQAMGAEAANFLIDRFQNSHNNNKRDNNTRHIQLDAKLISGGTTAPPTQVRN